MEEEVILRGESLSEGIAVGELMFLPHNKTGTLPCFSISVAEVEKEIRRYREALFSSKEDLRRLQKSLNKEGSSDAATIIDAHIQMLEDPMITIDMEEKVRQKHQNIEAVFRSTMSEYKCKMSKKKDAFFRQRLVDVMDLSDRILCHLCPGTSEGSKVISLGSVIYSSELIPSDIANMKPNKSCGFITDLGTKTSHAVLIARSKGIALVSKISERLIKPFIGKEVIVDGFEGIVILNPLEETLGKYKEKIKAKQDSEVRLYQNILPTETSDGYFVNLFVNVNDVDEIKEIPKEDLEGIGLFRTEVLFLQREEFIFSEKQQVEVYKEALKASGDIPVVFRVFDIGGDKKSKVFKSISESIGENRGIRFLLQRKDILIQQLRALLIASKHGNMRILLPFVTDVGEIKEVRYLINNIRRQLKDEGIIIDKKVLIGSMIETPAAVHISDALAEESDFLSVGTNDLTQYALAVDRRYSSSVGNYASLHPSLIKMLKMVAIQGARHNIPVSICGNMASDPLFIPLLLGIGIRRFSCVPSALKNVKNVIRSISILDAYKLVEIIFEFKRQEDIYGLLLDVQNKLSR